MVFVALHHCLNSSEATQVVWVNPSLWTCSSNAVANRCGWGGSPLPQFRLPGSWLRPLRPMTTDHTPDSTRTESAQLFRWCLMKRAAVLLTIFNCASWLWSRHRLLGCPSVRKHFDDTNIRSLRLISTQRITTRSFQSDLESTAANHSSRHVGAKLQWNKQRVGRYCVSSLESGASTGTDRLLQRQIGLWRCPSRRNGQK